MSNPAPGFKQHPGYMVAIEPLDATLSAHIGDTIIASSQRAVTVLETKHKPVWYIPLEDIEPSFLQASETETYCPFKGSAAYYNVRIDPGNVIEDAIWTYPSPYDECLELAGYASFYTNKVDVRIEGELADKSGPGWQK